MQYKIMSLFQLNTFLKDIEVRVNSLDWRQRIDAEYDILNLWNLPKGLGLKVKIGNFYANAPQGQQLSLSEQMIQWPEIFSEVGYIFSNCFVLILPRQLRFLV
jgi:vomeronasal 2 receptor